MQQGGRMTVTRWFRWLAIPALVVALAGFGSTAQAGSLASRQTAGTVVVPPSAMGAASRVDVAALVRTGTRTRPAVAHPRQLDSIASGQGAGSTAGSAYNAVSSAAVTSNNWSGYAVGTGPDTSVTGTFNVPNLAATPTETVTSEWVGIDGADNTSLIQAGVQEIYRPSTNLVYTSAWWEILPAPETLIAMTVTPGDSVTVTIWQVSGTLWGITVTDATTRQSFTTQQGYSGPGTSAEWIVEAPTSLSGTQDTLGMYGPDVTFSNLRMNGPETTLTTWTMVQGGVTVSVPSALTTAGFSVAYTGTPAPVPTPTPTPTATPAPSPTPSPVSSAPTIFTVSSGAPVTLDQSGPPNTAFTLQSSPDDLTWTTLAQLMTDPSGKASYTFTPTATAYYRSLFPDGPTPAGVGIVLPAVSPSFVLVGTPVITWGAAATFGVAIGAGPPRQIDIIATRDNVSWSRIASLMTDASGAASFTYRPATNLWYRAVFAGAPDLQAETSAAVRTVVRQIALARVANGGRLAIVSRGTSVTFTTIVRPDRPELPAPVATFRVYRWSGSAWTLYRTIVRTADATGVASLRWTFGSGGSWYVTSMANPTPYSANSVWSAALRYNVR